MKPILFVLIILFSFLAMANENDLSLDVENAYVDGPSCSVGSLTIPHHKKDPLVVPGCSVSCESGEKAVCSEAEVISAYYYLHASCKCVKKN